MRKLLYQWAAVGILSLIGWGVDVMPNNESWIPSAIIWGIAFIWLIGTVIYFIKHRLDKKAVKTPSIHQIKEQEAEISERIENRKKYLPQLKEAMNKYISRVEELANTNEEILNLAHYRKMYLHKIFRFWFIEYTEEQSLIVELYKRKVYQDNLIFRGIEDSDTILQQISLDIDKYNAHVKDRKVFTAAKGLRPASHIAYSYVVFNRLQRKYFDQMPFVFRFRYKTERKAIDRLRELQNETNQRIDELLEGAEDEL